MLAMMRESPPTSGEQTVHTVQDHALSVFCHLCAPRFKEIRTRDARDAESKLQQGFGNRKDDFASRVSKRAVKSRNQFEWGVFWVGVRHAVRVAARGGLPSTSGRGLRSIGVRKTAVRPVVTALGALEFNETAKDRFEQPTVCMTYRSIGTARNQCKFFGLVVEGVCCSNTSNPAQSPMR